jgi:hypothetical protein
MDALNLVAVCYRRLSVLDPDEYVTKIEFTSDRSNLCRSARQEVRLVDEAWQANGCVGTSQAAASILTCAC